MIDPSPEVEARLRTAPVGWLTTVDAQGQPQPSPIWFLWEEGRIVIWSKLGTPRLRNLAANPRIAFHLDADADGGSVVTIEGIARLDPDGPRAGAVPAYQAKYRRFIDEYGWTPESFDRDYPSRVVIEPVRLRAW